MFHGLEIFILLSTFVPSFFLVRENPRYYIRVLTVTYVVIVVGALLSGGRGISDEQVKTTFLYSLGLAATGGLIGMIIPLLGLLRRLPEGEDKTK